MNELLLIVLAYCIGSIPTAVWISKAMFGIDIREYGSGNAGATNTFRVLGSKWGTIVMVVDILKGVLATSLYILISSYIHDELHRTNLMIGLGLAAVLGHIFPIWANFKGGKGVATLLGMAIAIQPLVAYVLHRGFPAGTLPDAFRIAQFYSCGRGIYGFHPLYLQ
jgi:glycerol-3-phosphate acyltransferase PlsY